MPSMMDAYTRVTRVGWDIYPIGARAQPKDIPHGHRLGLVLILKKILKNCF
jgi:hypothetical protein